LVIWRKGYGAELGLERVEVTMGDALVTSQRLSDGAAIIDVRGELDVTTVAAFRALLVDTIARQQPVRVVVDMLHVTFMDSTGVGALVVGYNAAREIGADFVVRHPSPFVHRQLHITGLTDVFGLPPMGGSAGAGGRNPDAGGRNPDAGGRNPDTKSGKDSAPTRQKGHTGPTRSA
jgi:anti-sigma B factor antagonist